MSTWPLEQRIIGARSPHVDFLTATIKITATIESQRQLGEGRAGNAVAPAEQLLHSFAVSIPGALPPAAGGPAVRTLLLAWSRRPSTVPQRPRRPACPPQPTNKPPSPHPGRRIARVWRARLGQQIIDLVRAGAGRCSARPHPTKAALNAFVSMSTPGTADDVGGRRNQETRPTTELPAAHWGVAVGGVAGQVRLPFATHAALEGDRQYRAASTQRHVVSYRAGRGGTTAGRAPYVEDNRPTTDGDHLALLAFHVTVMFGCVRTGGLSRATCMHGSRAPGARGACDGQRPGMTKPEERPTVMTWLVHT